MYHDFQPRGAAKGLPPVRDELALQWLRHLAEHGTAVAAWRHADGRAIGHAVLVDSQDGEAELAVFVHQGWRGQGVGAALAAAAVEEARAAGYRRLWATMSPDNAAAIAMVKSCGFRKVSGRWQGDLIMELKLQPHESPG